MSRVIRTSQSFLESIPDALKATVRRVCMDLWEGSASAVAVALPKAQVVVDRFHVAIHDRDAVDTLRQTELLKRRCFGLDDPTELFRRLWLDIEGPRLWV